MKQIFALNLIIGIKYRTIYIFCYIEFSCSALKIFNLFGETSNLANSYFLKAIYARTLCKDNSIFY